jgi:biopolymer transport protein ExbB/TolQ
MGTWKLFVGSAVALFGLICGAIPTVLSSLNNWKGRHMGTWNRLAGSAVALFGLIRGAIPTVLSSLNNWKGKHMGTWKRVAVVGSSAALFGLVHGALLAVLHSGDRMYAFFYERSCVQHVSLYVTCLVAVLLLERARGQRRERARLAAPGHSASEDLAAVASVYEKQGIAAATECIERLTAKRQTEAQRAYDGFRFLIGVLPALGLLGTLLGLSDALFAAFSGGTLDSATLRQFVTGLATAMDATVLGMAAAAPLVGGVWFLSRREEALVALFAEHLRRRFDLQDFSPANRSTDVLQAELRRLTRKIADEAQLAFGKLLETSAQTYREQLEHAVQAVLAAQRAHDERMVHKLATDVGSSLRGSLDTVGDLIKEHNGQMAEVVIREVGQLRTALRRRTPEEVIIRYQEEGSVNNNGHARRKEVSHA